MHPRRLRVLKQCILLDQHTPTTDHIGGGEVQTVVMHEDAQSNHWWPVMHSSHSGG